MVALVVSRDRFESTATLGGVFECSGKLNAWGYWSVRDERVP